MLANSPGHRLAKKNGSGIWFGECECEGTEVFGGVCLQKSAEIEDGFLESVGNFISKVGVCPEDFLV